ncbi:ATP-binding protein [Bradyrhizobium sp. 162]|uniref:ATP-binding protein n=1 Tax=Bradyrhizobium sp. 162 TaxID=2782635 RepID=UPI001FFA99BE|nr:ATP-binding protein [Bradyrhizobium sp. 162]MCK1634712.1 ATP-binding protein [Bradyrhizobium sp. 162]
MISDAFLRALEDGSLSRLMESAFSAQDATSAPLHMDDADRFRFALALRGRCDPIGLLTDLSVDPQRWGFVLDQVAAECDSGVGSEQGLWLLSDAARRAQLSKYRLEEIAGALRTIAKPDLITKALLLILQGPVSLDALTADELRGLIAIEPAVAALSTAMPPVAEIRRHLALRSRLEEFDRFVNEGFIGRDSELDSLLRFIMSDHRKHKASTALMWGTGGIGKSTLIAALLSHVMRERDSRIVPVHLDFDRGDLSVVDTLTLTMELLRQVGTIDQEMDKELKLRREELRQLMHRRLSDPSYGSREKSSRDGMLFLARSLARLKMERRVLLIVFDTFENVESASDSTLRGLRHWIDRLIRVAGAYAVRLVVAGRSDPKSRNLDKIFGWRKPVVMRLDELREADACRMLETAGIPTQVALSLYKALGGNPLVLSLIRKLVNMGDGIGDMQSIADDVKSNVIPQELLQGVLYDRFLKHLKSDDARSYAHPGLVLPQLTPILIRRVLGPLKGEARMSEKRAKRIFDELAAASWLVHLEKGALIQRPDVRRLMLKLMVADSERGAEVKRVRLAAMLHHSKSRLIVDRAALAYHLLMRVETKDDLALLEGFNFSGTGVLLRRHLEDYPSDIARTFVGVLDFESGTGRRRKAIVRNSISAEQALTELPDDLWESFIGGDPGQPGEGDRLTEAGDPAVALRLWRLRRVGTPGRPPTFVLRALAETAEWNAGEVDIQAIAQELNAAIPAEGSKEVRPSELEQRLYWTTALALMAYPDGFAGTKPAFGTLIRVLRRLHGTSSRSSVFDELVSLTAIVEGICESEILPRAVFAASSPFASVTRLHLQRGRWSSRLIEWTVDLGSVVTLQRDFAERIGAVNQDIIRIGGSQNVFRSQSQASIASALQPVQQTIDQLDGRGSDEFLKVSFGNTKATIRVGNRASANPTLEAILLRGQTPELHRAARQALVEALGAGPAGDRDQAYLDRVKQYVGSIEQLLSVKPREFAPNWFASQAADDPKTAFLALVEFADRARVLMGVLDAALPMAVNPQKLVNVKAVLKAWDRALAGEAECFWGVPPHLPQSKSRRPRPQSSR